MASKVSPSLAVSISQLWASVSMTLLCAAQSCEGELEVEATLGSIIRETLQKSALPSYFCDTEDKNRWVE